MNDLNLQPRRPAIAAILSLLGGPLGQLYSGRGRRFVALSIITLVLIPLAALIAISLPDGRAAFNSLMVALVCWPIFLIVDAFRCAKQARLEPLHWYQRWWIYPLVLVAYFLAIELVSEFRRAFIADTFLVRTGPMNPTITPGDRILTTKLVHGTNAIDYGNVVVFHSKGPASPLYVMRVVALGGDTIEFKDESVYLNNDVIDEPYANFEGDLPSYRDLANMKRITVPANHFFVLGDARRRSMDSRFIGPIPNVDFRGIATRIFWSRPRKLVEDSRPPQYQSGSIAWDRIGKVIQ